MAGGLQFVTGVPVLATFRAGGGDVVAIDVSTATPYYADPLTGAVTPFAGGGGGGGMTNPMTTAGDIIVGGAAGAPTRLAAGANGQPLVLASGTEQWGITPSALTDAATIAVDASLVYVTLILTTAVGLTRTLSNPTNAVAGRKFTIVMQQPASGQLCQITWGTKYVGSTLLYSPGSGSTAPPQPTQKASALDVFTFDYNAALDLWVVGVTRGYRPSEFAQGTTRRPSTLNAVWYYTVSDLPAVQITGLAGMVCGSLSTTGAVDRMFEVVMDSDTQSPGVQMVGVCESTANFSNFCGSDLHGWGYFGNDGKAYTNNVGAVYGVAYGGGTNRDVIGVRVDASGNLFFYKNGTVQNTGTAAATGLSGKALFPAVSSGGATGTRRMILNTGQQPFQFPIAGVQAWG